LFIVPIIVPRDAYICQRRTTHQGYAPKAPLSGFPAELLAQPPASVAGGRRATGRGGAMTTLQIPAKTARRSRIV
jgi:hypothetical protein